MSRVKNSFLCALGLVAFAAANALAQTDAQASPLRTLTVTDEQGVDREVLGIFCDYQYVRVTAGEAGATTVTISTFEDLLAEKTSTTKVTVAPRETADGYTVSISGGASAEAGEVWLFGGTYQGSAADTPASQMRGLSLEGGALARVFGGGYAETSTERPPDGAFSRPFAFTVSGGDFGLVAGGSYNGGATLAVTVTGGTIDILAGGGMADTDCDAAALQTPRSSASLCIGDPNGRTGSAVVGTVYGGGCGGPVKTASAKVELYAGTVGDLYATGKADGFQNGGVDVALSGGTVNGTVRPFAPGFASTKSVAVTLNVDDAVTFGEQGRIVLNGVVPSTLVFNHTGEKALNVLVEASVAKLTAVDLGAAPSADDPAAPTRFQAVADADGAFALPETMVFNVSDNATFVVPAGVTLVNDAALQMKAGGALVVGEGATFRQGSGSVHVDSDASLAIRDTLDGATTDSLLAAVTGGQGATLILGDDRYAKIDTGWVEVTKWTDPGAYDPEWPGEVAGTTLEVATPGQLAALAVLANAGESLGGYTVSVTADLDMAGLEWVPIANFAGTFEGNGHTIANLTTAETAGAAGLFAAASGTIRDVIVADATIRAKDKTTFPKKALCAGALAGEQTGGTIERCVVRGVSVTGEATGEATGAATGQSGVGGLVGNAAGTVRDCLAEDVTLIAGETVRQGALVGLASGTVATSFCAAATPVGDATGATLTQVYAKDAGRYVRHDGSDAEPVVLGEAAALNGIGWLLNRQATGADTTWRVDSNDSCATLLPFAVAGVAETIPDVPRYLTVAWSGEVNAIFANGHSIVIDDAGDGQILVSTAEPRPDYQVVERLASAANGHPHRTVYGGALDADTAGDLAITVNGGTLTNLYGGGAAFNKALKHEGDITIVVKGGAVTDSIFGGGTGSGTLAADVTGTVSITLDGGTFATPELESAVICGAAEACGDVGAVAITVNGGNVYAGIRGGCGRFDNTVGSVSIALNGGTLTREVAALNLGTLTGSASVSLGASATPLVLGANAFIVLSGGNTATSTATALADGATLSFSNTNASVRPTVYLGFAAALAKGKNTIALSGPADLRGDNKGYIVPSGALKDAALTIPTGQTLTLGAGTVMTVPAGRTLTVKGAILSADGTLVGANGTSLLDNAGSALALAKGTLVWSTAAETWAQALARDAAGTYYADVASALASASTAVTLLNRAAATSAVRVSTQGDAKTLSAGEAYDVAALLGGAFTVSADKATLGYAYEFGIDAVAAGTADAPSVGVRLTERGAPVARTLTGRTLTVLVGGMPAKTVRDPAFDAEGRCTVTLDAPPAPGAAITVALSDE